MSRLPPRSSARQVAAFLGFAKETVCAMAERGEFANAYRKGRRWRIPRESVLAWEAKQAGVRVLEGSPLSE